MVKTFFRPKSSTEQDDDKNLSDNINTDDDDHHHDNINTDDDDHHHDICLGRTKKLL